MEIIGSITNAISLLLGLLAAISLLVGGIGVMNTMFVIVTERTREIGLRKSLGARNDDILSQFVLEAVLISLAGGIIGVFFLPVYISKKNPVRIKNVVDHIDHIRDIGGVNVIALGSDFDGMSKYVRGLEHAGKLSSLTEALLKKGYTKTEIKKILGNNFLRFFNKFEKK